MTKQLAVYDTTLGRLFGIDPADATSVGVPAFRYGVTRPPAGSLKGEAFINKTTGIASVWDGNTWTDIAKPVVIPYPDDATLLADTPPNETIAMSQSTGNVFTRVNNQWFPMGVRVYPTYANMWADTPAQGTVAYSVDTGDFTVRVGNQWAKLSHQGVNVGTTAPNNPVQGNLWLDTTTATAPVLKFYDGANWTYAGSQITVGGTAPANPAVGHQWFDSASNTLFTWDGNAWQPPMTGVPVGTIITHASVSPPAGFLLCDGSAIPAGTQFDSLRTMIGANVPDLRDQFIRGASSQAQIDGFTKHSYSTAKPHNDFHVHATGRTSTGGSHHHHISPDNAANNWSGGSDWDRVQATWNGQGGSNTNTAGSHLHSVSVDGTVHGGGDTETAPVHVRLAMHIKAF